MKFFNKFIIASAILLLSVSGYGQYTTKKVRSVHQVYTDSLKQIEYNYVFPFLGQGAYRQGFDIPYPIGFMANYFWSDQGILIDNFQLGYQSAYNPDRSFPLQPFVDENGTPIIKFGDSRNQAWSLNVRPDIWIFPFLNVYGIFGVGGSITEVNIESVFGNEDLSFSSSVDQKINTAGVGVMAAGGVGPVWISGDFNVTWNKPELLDKATLAIVMGLRLGKTFTFKKKPYSNIAVWIGTMRVDIQSETIGAIKLQDAVSQEFWDKKDQFVADYNAWYDANYNDLSLKDKIKADLLMNVVEGIDQRDGESIIQYGMDKQVTEKWNMLLGAQYQINKRWQIRFEAGLIGDRKSFLSSVNYRLLGFKKKKVNIN
jgi:opacity protein-like surface antigen